MKKTILKYGLISGVLCAVMLVSTLPLEGRIGFDHSYYVGYTLIVLSFLLVFFGIRSYRDTEGNGRITFGKAFAVGISIMLIVCVFYVATWEVLYFTVMHDYMDKYAAYVIEKARASGASAAAIAAKTEEMKKAKAMYEKPLYNVAITFLEPFPVGLVMTLISAALLRRRERVEASGAVVSAAL